MPVECPCNARQPSKVGRCLQELAQLKLEHINEAALRKPPACGPSQNASDYVALSTLLDTLEFGLLLPFADSLHGLRLQLISREGSLVILVVIILIF